MKSGPMMKLLDKLSALKQHVESLRDQSYQPQQQHLWDCLKSLNDATNHVENCLRLNENANH
jgi:hypothetical protein